MKSTSHGTSIDAHEIGHEEDRAFQDADEEQVSAAVVLGDRGAELADAALERVLVDEDFLHRAGELVYLAHAISSSTASSHPGAAAMPGT